MRPASKLSTLGRRADCTLGTDLDVAGATTDEIYAAMDWLLGRQDAIESKLAAKHLGPEGQSGCMVLFDPTSSWAYRPVSWSWPRARRTATARRAASRSNTPAPHRPRGCPVAVRLFPGNTADPDAFTDIVEVVRTRFSLENLVLVADPRHDHLRPHRRARVNPTTIPTPQRISGGSPRCAPRRSPHWPPTTGRCNYPSFHAEDLAEIAHPDLPGELLYPRPSSALAAELTRKRRPAAGRHQKLVAPIIAPAAAGRLAGADNLGVAVGKVINKQNTAKDFYYTITDTSLAIIERHHDQIAAEAALDYSDAVPTDYRASHRPRRRRRHHPLQEPGPHRTRLSHHQSP